MTLQGEEINTEAVGDSVNTAALKCHSNVCTSLSVGKSVQNGSISSVYASFSIMWKCSAHLNNRLLLENSMCLTWYWRLVS